MPTDQSPTVYHVRHKGQCGRCASIDYIRTSKELLGLCIMFNNIGITNTEQTKKLCTSFKPKFSQLHYRIFRLKELLLGNYV